MNPLVICIAMTLVAEPRAEIESLPVSWGQIDTVDRKGQVFRARVEKAGAASALEWPASLPNALCAYLAADDKRIPLAIVYGEKPPRMTLRLPEGFSKRPRAEREIVIESIASGGQRHDGRIVLNAGDAALEGSAGRHELAAGQQPIAFGVGAPGRAAWSHKATRPGTYVAEVTYALPGEQNEAIQFELAGKELAPMLPPTGESNVFSTHTCGKIAITSPSEIAVSVAARSAGGLRVLGLTLRPACEGTPVVQKEPGEIILHARDVTIRGVQVQYEPRPEKNTIGYWTNPEDQVTWEFLVREAGAYDVEILQGCGAGQGGSEVELSIGNAALRFTVKDTGHFQNFVPRTIGQVKLENGHQSLRVRPLRKAGIAIMDLRQVRLIPAR